VGPELALVSVAHAQDEHGEQQEDPPKTFTDRVEPADDPHATDEAAHGDPADAHGADAAHGDDAHADEGHGADDAHALDAHGDDVHAAGAHGDHDVHHTAHQRAMVLSLLVAGLGILVSFLTYGRKIISSAGMLAAFPNAHRVLTHKYYFDEFYGAVVWRGLLGWNKLLATFDKYVVDGLVNASGYMLRAVTWISGMIDRYFVDGLVNATGDLMRSFGRVASAVQNGRIQTYFLGLVSGLVILILVYRVAWPS
jgi:NADH-quinone oxidoreductase subunit L